MTRPVRHRLVHAFAAVLLAAVAAGAGAVAGPADAGAVDSSKGSAGYCPNGNGVTVIIDFQELGGDSIVRCAPGDQATGLAALQNAGIEVTGVARWGLAFICRIEGKPGPDTEACIDTPPATAYWSYWYAPNGGPWKYSQRGVMNRKPPLGSFEGWSFSLHHTADTNPPPRLAPTRPGATGGGSTGGGGNGSGGQGSAGGSNGGGAAPGGSGGEVRGGASTDPLAPSPGLKRPGPTSTAQLPGGAPSSAAASGPGWTGGDETSTRAVADSRSSGLPGGTLLGVGALAALVLVAVIGVQARRRSQRADPWSGDEPDDAP
jgi:hypothetical protein